MRKLMIVVTALTLVGLVAVGCGGQEAPGPGDEGKPPIAYEFHPGVTKFSEGQTKCPVCGQTGIKEELYADADGNRIYFDKKECQEKFTGNESEYLQNLRTGMAQQAEEGGPEQ